MITGASRGIGKATAIALAAAGFDVAITARTLRAGQGRDDSDVGHDRPVPGSLEETAAAARAHGARALPLFADLLDRTSLEAAAAAVLDQWGRIDVLVNNAIYTGPGGMVPFLDLTADQLETRLRANVVAQFVTSKAVLPAMLEAGGGTIIDVTSHVAVVDPPRRWARGVGARVRGLQGGLPPHRRHPVGRARSDRGIRAVNVDPGFVDTERQLQNATANGLAGHYRGAPPSVPAAVIAWLATAPEASAYDGQTVRAQKLALERDLHPTGATRRRPPGARTVSATVEVVVDERVAVVTLNRPEVRNALSAELVADLGAAISALDRDDEVAAIVLTGADPAFCAGFDLRQLATELRDVMGPGARRPASATGAPAGAPRRR